jgi:hypothetical protein
MRSVVMLERVLTASVLNIPSSPITLLRVRLDIHAVPMVALVVVNVLVPIVEFARRVLTVKDVSEMVAMERVLADRVLNTAFGPVTVLTERVDRIVVPLAERVLKKAVAPVSVLTLNVLVVRVLIAALFPTIVLAVRLLIAAVAVVRLGRLNVLVASVLNVAFVPVNVLT